jgi:hypothetical protein
LDSAADRAFIENTKSIAMAGIKSPHREAKDFGLSPYGLKRFSARTSPNSSGVVPGLPDRSNHLRPEPHHQTLTQWWLPMLGLHELSNLFPSIACHEARAAAVA